MKLRRSLGLAVAGVFLIGVAVASRNHPVQDAGSPAPVVFVCRNGVAMSVWSAAYFNRLAAERGLRERAVARAAIPSFREVPLRMRFALALDGFRLDSFRPKVVDAADARGAELVVAIDTELPPEALVGAGTGAERWQGFPPMREHYFPSRAALRQRVEALVARLATGAPS
jgi:hypothetical protein